MGPGTVKVIEFFPTHKDYAKRMERQNGEVRDREKVMCGLKKDDSPVIDGIPVYHNYFRPNEGLQGKTPSEAAGIKIEGGNPWITLIQNAVKPEPIKDRDNLFQRIE